jgi:hypothetical protein
MASTRLIEPIPALEALARDVAISLARKCRIAATLLMADAAPRSFMLAFIEDPILFGVPASSPPFPLRCATEATLCLPEALAREEFLFMEQVKELLDACDAATVPFVFVVLSDNYDGAMLLVKLRVAKHDIEHSCCAAQCPDEKSSRERMQCSRCHGVFYCSRECQLRDWSLHKAHCFGGGGDAK